MNVAHHQRDKPLGILARPFAVFTARARRRQHALKAHDAEFSPARGKLRFGDLLYAFKCHVSILLCVELGSKARVKGSGTAVTIPSQAR